MAFDPTLGLSDTKLAMLLMESPPQERGLPGACRSLERPASVLADRLSRPELDKGVATALSLRIENPRAVADLDLFDGQLRFQLDRTKGGAAGNALPLAEHVARAVGIDHLDPIERNGAVLDIEAQSPEAPVTRHRDDVSFIAQAAPNAHKQRRLPAKIEPAIVGRGKGAGPGSGLEPAVGILAVDLQPRLAAAGLARVDKVQF